MKYAPQFGPKISPGGLPFLRSLAIGGAATVMAGAALEPDRLGAAVLAAGPLLTGFSLFGVVFIAIQYAAGSVGARLSGAFQKRWRWSYQSALPFSSQPLPPTRPATGGLCTLHTPDSSSSGSSGLSFSRVRLCMSHCRNAFAFAIVPTSRRQDGDGSAIHTHRNVRLSVTFLIIFALTFWLASVDWVMLLEPHWFSTIFGIYRFAGMFSIGLALLILLVLWLRHSGPPRDFVNEEHLHNLGKLLFAFSTFWMYIWFSKYMLIWYANIGEETVFYVARLRNVWGPLFLLNMLLNWVVPFAALLPRGSKRSARSLGRVAASWPAPDAWDLGSGCARWRSSDPRAGFLPLCPASGTGPRQRSISRREPSLSQRLAARAGLPAFGET